jgi:hypothetical protein
MSGRQTAADRLVDPRANQPTFEIAPTHFTVSDDVERGRAASI